jgi:hypothetical protein
MPTCGPGDGGVARGVRVKRFGFGVSYALMGAVGVAVLLALPDVEAVEDRHVSLFAGSFFALIGGSGLALVLFIPLSDRYRAAAVVATAPSGAPALFFRRSPFMLVFSVVMTFALAVWSGSAALMLGAYGHELWAALLGAFALVLLWPVAVVPTGKVRSGGLWLTPAGVEYRKEAVGWTLPWSELHAVDDRGDAGTPVGALPQAAGLGVAAVAPVLLVLTPGARPRVRRTARWVWNRECRVREGMLCVDCFDLAAGRPVIVDMLGRCLAYPRFRAQLGTEWALPHRPT